MDADLIERWTREARESWPSVFVDEARFRAYVLSRVEGGEAGGLEGVRGAELYLACACDAGMPEAVAALEHRYFHEVNQAVARLRGSSPEFAAEVLQKLRIRLLVGEPGAPRRISDYLGRGPLAGWLCTAGVRLALSQLRQEERLGPLEEDALLASPLADPELVAIRDRFRAEFKTAFAHAVRTLEPRQRTSLRMNVLEGLNIDQIGRVFSVHRSTVARWLSAAREQLLDQTRDQLAHRLRLSERSLDSLLQLVDAELEVSLEVLLRSQTPSAAR
jgi:RNA polymerase sigma-70 factor (ECF subfamily)